MGAGAQVGCNIIQTSHAEGVSTCQAPMGSGAQHHAVRTMRQCSATADSLRTHGPEPLLIRPRPLSHNSIGTWGQQGDKGVRQHSSLPRLDGK